MTDVRTYTQSLLHERTTGTTVLTRVLWGNRSDRNVMQHAIVLDPEQEPAPTSIVNGLGEVMVLDHITYFQVFVGNQIARGDKRVCRLPGKIFTLPTDLQMRLSQMLSGLFPVFRSLVLAGDLPLQALKSFFRLAVVAGVLDGVTLRVRIIGFKPTSIPTCFPLEM